MTRLPRHKHPFHRRGLLYSLALCFVILFLGGAGFWAIDPAVTTLGDGMWLAFTTAATVGYGDIVPSTPLARVFSAGVVLLGLAVLSTATASVAAIFVEQEEREVERDLMRELGLLREEVQAMHHLLEATRGAAGLSPATASAPHADPRDH